MIINCVYNNARVLCRFALLSRPIVFGLVLINCFSAWRCDRKSIWTSTRNTWKDPQTTVCARTPWTMQPERKTRRKRRPTLGQRSKISICPLTVAKPLLPDSRGRLPPLRKRWPRQIVSALSYMKRLCNVNYRKPYC